MHIPKVYFLEISVSLGIAMWLKYLLCKLYGFRFDCTEQYLGQVSSNVALGWSVPYEWYMEDVKL